MEGGAAQARKKRRAPVSVFAEQATVEAVGASSRAFAGGKVKRTRRDRNTLDARGGRGPADGRRGIRGRVGRRRFCVRACEYNPAVGCARWGAGVPGAGGASCECFRGLSGLRGCLFPAPYGHPGPGAGVTFDCLGARILLATIFITIVVIVGVGS